IMARTRSEAEFIGKAPSPDFSAMLTRTGEGSWRSTMLEGIPAYASMSRSPITGWTVGIGLPATDIEEPIRRSMWALGFAGVLILAIGVVCALVLSVFIVRALTAAASAARALARGEQVITRRSRIAEVDET